MPIAATIHSEAAVVSPRTVRPFRMIAPAPRKPMPLTTCAAIRDGSRRTRTFGPPEPRTSWKPKAETIVNSAAPIATSMWVRSPASCSRHSRSIPIAAPSAAATASRAQMLAQLSSWTSLARSIDRLPLRGGELVDPDRREIEQLVEPGAIERDLLGGRLHLDEPAVAGHDDVQVDVGVRVLRVVE